VKWAAASAQHGQRLSLRERALTLRLAVRLLRPRGPAELVSAVWVTAATAVLISSLFVMLGFLGSLSHRPVVLAQRTPIWTEKPSVETARPTVLGLEQENDVGGASLIRLVVSPAEGSDFLPPGIPRWPAPGEVFASPGAARLISQNAYAAALAPGRMVGAVDRDALRDPDEAYVIVGETAEQLRATGLSSAIGGFGGNVTVLADITSSQLLKIISLVAIVLAGGGAVLLTTVTRLASRARRRRISVLQLMGASTAMIGSLAAVTTGVLACLGAVVACVIAEPLGRFAASVGVSGVHWWPGSSWSTGPVMVFVSIVVVMAVAATARRTIDHDPWARRRDAAERRPSAARALPFFVGVCMLGGVLFTQHRNVSRAAGLSASGALILLVSLLALTVGAPFAAPVITRAAGVSATRLPGLSWRLAGARARHHALSTARIAGAIMALALITGVTIGVWNIAQSRYDHSSGGTLEVSLIPPPGTSWAPSLVTATLTRADLVTATVIHNPQTHPGPPAEQLTRPEQMQGDDIGYTFVLPTAAARGLAAQVELSHPGTQQHMFDHEMSGPYAVMLDSSAVLLAQYFSTIIVVLSLAIILITLQQDRSVPDAALLMSGLSRARLRSARANEVVLSVLPGVLLAVAVAWLVARAVSHVDDPTVAVPSSPLIALAVAAVSAGGILAGIAAAVTPALDPATTRRD
jgi:hypothetical protein